MDDIIFHHLKHQRKRLVREGQVTIRTWHLEDAFVMSEEEGSRRMFIEVILWGV